MPDKRYPEDWARISRDVKEDTNYVCSCCHKRKARETHHTLYKIFSFVIPKSWAKGIFLFGLCIECHDDSHILYTKYKHKYDFTYLAFKNDWLNRNTIKHILYLNMRYRILKLKQYFGISRIVRY